MINYIIQTNRQSLISSLKDYFDTFSKTKNVIINLSKSEDILKFKNEILNNQVKYFVFSNGSDPIDVRIYHEILKINPDQKCLFSENAWLTWQDFLYLDDSGIGNKCSVYDYTDIPIVNIPKSLSSLVNSKVSEQLNKGIECPLKDYVLVPLQVDGDSKIIIGSPHFKTVTEFIMYIIDMVPSNVTILFKNHPLNKNAVPIPKRDNVIDITNFGYSKKSLILNSLFVAGINSTFLIESIYLRNKTVAYGLDIFSNKNIVIDGYNKDFDTIVNADIEISNIDNFINLLISKQIPKNHMTASYKIITTNEETFTPCCTS